MRELLRRTQLGVLSLFFSLAAKPKEADPMQAQKTAGRIYEFEMRTIDGRTRKLAEYRGHPLLIVNVASLCGFTPQYKDLEALHEKYGPKGLRIAAFPANEFGQQEPGSDAEIKEFCRTKYSVSFDLYSKIVVKGPGIHPLYAYLTKESGYPGEIPWNFSKFLVDKRGKVVGRFGPEDGPTGKAIVSAVESALAQ